MESLGAEALPAPHNSSRKNNTNHVKKKTKRRRRQHRRDRHKQSRSRAGAAEGSQTPLAERGGPLLRPAGTQVPRAPENSTQFIMDDHENSTLFLNFEEACGEDDRSETSA